MFGDAKSAGGVDGVFGDVALDALIVAEPCRLLGKAATLTFHLVGELPCAADHFVDTPHALTVGTEHRNRADIVEHILGGDRLGADTAFGKGNIFR